MHPAEKGDVPDNEFRAPVEELSEAVVVTDALHNWTVGASDEPYEQICIVPYIASKRVRQLFSEESFVFLLSGVW